MKVFLTILAPLLLLVSCQRPSSGQGESESSSPSAKSEADAKVPATLVGLQLAEAEGLADKAHIPHRVTMIDGKSRPVTMDYRQDRLNFTVVNGVVTAVKKG